MGVRGGAGSPAEAEVPAVSASFPLDFSESPSPPEAEGAAPRSEVPDVGGFLGGLDGVDVGVAMIVVTIDEEKLYTPTMARIGRGRLEGSGRETMVGFGSEVAGRKVTRG